MSNAVRFCLLTVTFLFSGVSLQAHAALGPYLHGHGVKSSGFGGIGIATGEESTVITANPALIGVIGQRFDLSLDVAQPSAKGSIRGNAAGPDERYETDLHSVLVVPSGGFIVDFDGPWSMGMTIALAGLGLDYDNDNPYERFGGGSDAEISLAQSGILTSLAYNLSDDHVVAASLNIVYQTLSVKGVTPFAIASQSPTKVSNTGRDGSMGLGFGLGWYKQFGPDWSFGLAYRSKTWTKRHSEYAGLLPEQGKLELPAHYGVGVAWKPVPWVTLAVDLMRYEYTQETVFANGVEKFNQGIPFGADNGPGFGFRDQNVYKFGAAWQATENLKLRAGYVDASQMVRPQNTFVDFLAAMHTTEHYSAGFTYGFSKWELSGYVARAPRVEVKGKNSIPAALGGGEADNSNHFYATGISLGRRFGRGG